MAEATPSLRVPGRIEVNEILRVACIVLTFLLAAVAARSQEQLAAAQMVEPYQPNPPFGLSGGADNREALIDLFLDAVAKNDKAALDALRLTKDEYQGIIVPGRVAPGAPPRRVSAIVDKYFWEVMDFKSDNFVDVLLERFGGRTYKRRAARYTSPERSYDWYRAWGEVRQTVTDDSGIEYEITSGWIAEVDGKYKFLSFEWDD